MGPIKPLAGVVTVIALSACPNPGRTSLVVESYGAFSYIKAADNSKLEIAALKTVPAGPICNHEITQEGIELFVESGVIVQPSPAPATKTFDLKGAQVSFPDLENSSEVLDANRTSTGTACQQWTDLSCVASVSAQFPSSPLDPNWKSAVDAVIRVTRGKVEGGPPSDVAAEASQFDFKPLMTATPAFVQRMTDRVIVRASVPANRIVINLENVDPGVARKASGISQIIVQPAGNRPVRLRLMTRHSHGVDPQLNPGDPVEHFCAFYALRTNAPGAAAQLIPHLAQANLTPGGQGQPFPGPYCSPDWTP